MAENRTEQATPRRRQQAREKGQVLRSRDLVSAFTLLAVVALFTWHPEGWIRRWHSYFSHTLAAGALSDWNDQLPVVTWTALGRAMGGSHPCRGVLRRGAEHGGAGRS